MKIHHYQHDPNRLARSVVTGQSIFAPAPRGNCVRPGNALVYAYMALAFVALTALTARAGFEVNWSTIDGGGGTSTGGVFTVRGTIGQPDAGGAMTNGQYSVTGGFWSLPAAIQVAGAPTLAISGAAPGFAMISWSPNMPGFVLQES